MKTKIMVKKEKNDDDIKEDETLIDAPGRKSEARFRSPERKKASKRKKLIHGEEPDLKKIISDHGEMEDIAEDNDLDIDSIIAKKEDQNILYHAILGHDLTEVYSNKRLQLASDRRLVSQILSTDISEMFSPERVTAVCKDYGLKPGQAMDIKNGFDFDLSSDRDKAWESILRDKPMLVIGSPPCTFFSR